MPKTKVISENRRSEPTFTPLPSAHGTFPDHFALCSPAQPEKTLMSMGAPHHEITKRTQQVVQNTANLSSGTHRFRKKCVTKHKNNPDAPYRRQSPIANPNPPSPSAHIDRANLAGLT
jgi:hypothetical protein